MNIIVTAGNTQVPIDDVRCVTNIFSGRTGTAIALAAQRRGHAVTLLTSHPELAAGGTNLHVHHYRTFADLEAGLAEAIVAGRPDVVIHCAAVSDYRCTGVFAPAAGTNLNADLHWESAGAGAPALVERGAAKVSSGQPVLWLRLEPTAKLIDRIRRPWGFQGILVKFKLEAGPDAGELQAIAEASRRQSEADLMVANTLAGRDSWALLGPLDGAYRRIDRADLPTRLLDAVERKLETRNPIP